jgi:coenzyme PQQ precursor peptide PqqA
LRAPRWLNTLLTPAKGSRNPVEDIMAWTTPTLVEICIGLEINGYLPAEF